MRMIGRPTNCVWSSTRHEKKASVSESSYTTKSHRQTDRQIDRDSQTSCIADSTAASMRINSYCLQLGWRLYSAKPSCLHHSMNIFHLKINAVKLVPGFLISYTRLHRWKWIWKNGTYQKQFFTSWVPTWGLTRLCPFKLSHKYIASSIQFWQISFNVTLTEIQNFISNICRKITAFLVHFLQLIQVHCTVQWNQVYNICHKIRLSFWFLFIREITLETYKDVYCTCAECVPGMECSHDADQPHSSP